MSDKETYDVTPHFDKTEQAFGPAPLYGRAIGFVAGGIGDQIYHLGQLRALAGACRTGTIDIACIHPGPVSRILAATPWVGRVIDARPLRRYLPGIRGSETVKALRFHRYDTAFFMHRSTSFKLAARAAGIPRRIGLADGMVDRVLLQESLSLAAGGARRDLWGHRPFIAAIDEYVMSNGLPLAPDIPTILPERTAVKLAQKMVEGLPRPISIVNLFALDNNRRWPVAAAIDVIAKLPGRTPRKPICKHCRHGKMPARQIAESNLNSWSTALGPTPRWSATLRSTTLRTAISVLIPSPLIWR